jgi:hypothetical protein
MRMDKFSLIQEDHNLGRFSITRQQLNYYKNEVNKVLHGVYSKDLVREDDFGTFVKPQSFEPTPDRHISILNKVNTNLRYLSYLVDTFDLSSIGDVVKFINDNKEDLFTKNGKHLSILIKIIRGTEQDGEKNEELASRYIKSIIFEKKSIDVNPIISPISSKKDLVDGIDIEFQIESSRKYTCQVKPFKGRREISNNVIITSSGLIKEYKVDYICFADHRSNKACLFKNRGFKIIGNSEIQFPKESEVI